MPRFRTFTVTPSLPESLKDLKVLAHNMLWAWDSEIVDLFRRIDNELWRTCGHNPVALLGSVPQARLYSLAEDEGFLYQLKQAKDKFDEIINAPTWYEKVYTKSSAPTIAYFSAEFGIHESLPIYSGGLGILAGDHLKSASDLGIPLIAIGLLYQKGYFRQYLNTDGWQQEHLEENDFHNMPIDLVRKKSKRPLMISVQFPQRSVKAQIWQVNIGRIKLFLLDTNINENSEADRAITEQLYGGDVEMRIQQEILLGIGGLKALMAMNIEPTVCHMNEGHAAFMALERVRRLRSDKAMTFEEAVEAAKVSNVFTIHTPVAAGNDEFSVELIDKYFSHYYGKLGINRKQFLALGRIDPDDEKEKFKMPVLALKMSAHRNGVSELHGYVSRKMWSGLWPGFPNDEVPIKSVTNGVHAKTWLSGEINYLFERYLGANWSDESIDKSIWENIDDIPDEEIWRIHQRCKERLISFARKRLKMQMERRGAFHTEFSTSEAILDPEALTIGFARRFATYKRGNLLMKDKERLINLLNDSRRPLQFIFAGKAHPRDGGGKEIIREIVHFSSQDQVRGKILFLEDYDMNVARYLVQGVDVWLNNPRRPLEASGTSGMKAAINGVLNFSTLDGWWCEGYTPDSGWIIGAGEEYDDKEYQDLVESQAIYNLLENEIIPLYYLAAADGIPRSWIKRMKNTIKWCAPRFNTNRMVAEYTRKFYNPAATKWTHLAAESMSRIRALSMWKSKVQQSWSDVVIQDVKIDVDNGVELVPLNPKQPQLEVGSRLTVTVSVNLGSLSPDDIAVEIYHGKVHANDQIEHGTVTRLSFEKTDDKNQLAIFGGKVLCEVSGQHGFAARVIASNADMVESHEPGLMRWEPVVTE